MPSALGQAARELLTAIGTSTSDDEVDDRIGALAEALPGAPDDEAGEALAILAAGLRATEPARAGVAARVIGAMVEAGVPPAAARDAMLDSLRWNIELCVELAQAAAAAVPPPPQDLDAERVDEWLTERESNALQVLAAQNPAAADAWQRLGATWPGAIALLSVDPGAREQASDLIGAAERICELHEAAGWLRSILSVPRDEPFVAIEPATRTGIAGRMSGVVENLQLSVLLMDAFPGERRVSEAAAAVARGDGPQRIDEQVSGAWSLYTYEALRPGGALPAPADHSAGHAWIVDEGLPAAIPRLDDHRVILLGPPAHERSWQAQRMFLKLPATLDAHVLDETAVGDWLGRIAAAA